MVSLYRDPLGENVFSSSGAVSEHGLARSLSRSGTIKEQSLNSTIESLKKRIKELEATATKDPKEVCICINLNVILLPCMLFSLKFTLTGEETDPAICTVASSTLRIPFGSS